MNSSHSCKILCLWLQKPFHWSNILVHNHSSWQSSTQLKIPPRMTQNSRVAYCWWALSSQFAKVFAFDFKIWTLSDVLIKCSFGITSMAIYVEYQSNCRNLYKCTIVLTLLLILMKGKSSFHSQLVLKILPLYFGRSILFIFETCVRNVLVRLYDGEELFTFVRCSKGAHLFYYYFWWKNGIRL